MLCMNLISKEIKCQHEIAFNGDDNEFITVSLK